MRSEPLSIDPHARELRWKEKLGHRRAGVNRTRRRGRVGYTRGVLRRRRVARGFVLVATGLAISFAGACADSPADPPAIPLPERLPSSEAGDGAGIQDAPRVDVGLGDGASDACRDGTKGGAETDVDCGGPTCAACANGRACVANRDCAALVCTGSTCSGDVGCSDGTREGFTPVATYTNIAACAGAWSVAGLLAPATKTPACQRSAGNDGLNTSGAGCTVADLCQVGWHVCETAPEVGAKSGAAGCAAAAGLFFVTRQSGAGAAQCGAGANDLFGCGGAGAAPDPTTCAPLDRFSGDLCASLAGGWSCGADGLQEANNVTHTNSADGGVLCCRD